MFEGVAIEGTFGGKFESGQGLGGGNIFSMPIQKLV
jgi:hypothetical protein